MFDSHCHLNFKAFADDVNTVIDAMAETQVAGLVVGCDPQSSRTAVDLAQNHPHLWASVGVHPIHVLDHPWDPITMKELALEEKVVAIGEVGLDFYRFPDAPVTVSETAEPESNASLKARYLAAQYATFEGAIDLAQEVEKPLVIHSREAYDEIISVLTKKFANRPVTPLRGTIHCFMGNWNQAQNLLELGFMIGFTGVITYNDIAPSLIEVVKRVPLDRLLIETDAPYLTPEPYRTEGRGQGGKSPRNLPQYSRDVAEAIARLRPADRLNADQVVELTEHNAQHLFAIRKIIYP